MVICLYKLYIYMKKAQGGRCAGPPATTIHSIVCMLTTIIIITTILSSIIT